MATTVVARELLVTSLRGIIEGAGGDFSASWLGKWKMVVQCASVVAVLLSFLVIPNPTWLAWATPILLWSAIFITIYSGVDYSLIAAKVLRSQGNDGENITSDSVASPDPHQVGDCQNADRGVSTNPAPAATSPASEIASEQMSGVAPNNNEEAAYQPPLVNEAPN